MPIEPSTLQIWGRANSVNVQKVLWCCRELGVVYQRIDAGMAFGRTGDADYLAMNPNGRIPTLVEGDFVLWESNAIMRYLTRVYGRHSGLYPADARICAGMERWLDWTLSTLQPVERPLFWGLVRTPLAERDMAAMQQAADLAAVQWHIVDRQLAQRDFMEGDQLSLADIAIGTYARRWLGVEGVARPALPNLRRWFDRISTRPGFQEFVAPAMS
ncbi:MAG: glutathione S-transferase family protein [Tardiphaga sp.]|jgi:glutathione S-transferase|nr:glutathione S-transferase family protein [Tardiphaga sp.]